eukprot:jgi/Botrbrau1/12582/Bobra.0169s0112.1
MLTTVLGGTFRLVVATSVNPSVEKSCASGLSRMATSAPEGLPNSAQETVDAVLQMYRSRDINEQADVLEKHYHSTAHFVDPLMNCKGTKEILLAFYSLIKIFDTVQIEQLSAKLSKDPRLPPGLASQNIEQVVVQNHQIYTFARTSRLSKWLLPQQIDIDSQIFLTLDAKDGRILWHEDTWPGKGSMPSLLKRPVGIASFGTFRMLGWGKGAPDL